ncbi:MAG: Rpn family recombination-promoting nuclease/putative transposase [Bacteroidota bacterium]
MGNKKGNIHDENFKHNFTSENVARDFLKHNLPKKVLEKIDLSTVRVESNDLVPSRYRSKRRAAVIYSVENMQGERIYAWIHLESQSTHDKNMAIRVWEYHVAISRVNFKRGYKKIPLILTFVLYHGKEKWTSAKSIAELFQDFGLYCDVALKSPFLINLPKEEIEKLKRQEAAAAPQIIMKQQAKGEYCEFLPDIWELMKKHGQDDDENIDYMATNDKHEASEFLEKFSKLDPKTANDYKIMFEHAIQKEVKKELKKEVKKATRKVKVEALKEGKQQGLQQGIQAIKDFLKEGFITKEQAEKKIQELNAQKS